MTIDIVSMVRAGVEEIRRTANVSNVFVEQLLVHANSIHEWYSDRQEVEQFPMIFGILL